MGYFPFFVDISGKKCVIIGGGNVAERKAKKLLLFDADITVIAPKICDGIKADIKIKKLQREFCDSDIDGAFLVIGASDDSALNRHISKLCTKKNIPVNIVDEPELCSFYFPAVIQKKNISVGISTGGESPLFARFLREKFESEINDELIKTVEILSETRNKIKDIFPTSEERKEVLEELLMLCIENNLPEDLNEFLERKRYDNKDRNTKKQACACPDGNGSPSDRK